MAQKFLDEALDLYCDKIEQSDGSEFGITDYFPVDLYFALLKRFKDSDSAPPASIEVMIEK